MIGADHIVEFVQWCNKCKYENSDSTLDPCNDCLNHPVNQDSRRPVNFTPRNSQKNQPVL